ncbi:hypothetical protein LCGC14_1875240 [marine sediment metagenome]|uniref:Uncharacterized protein n=1 Tax=marine sediment metagenome TaxID=412755 RepID=A0A0F9G409_9ZZZZ
MTDDSMTDWLARLRDYYWKGATEVGTTAAKVECAYCGEPLDPEDPTTCPDGLCVAEYWKETNAESLRGG